MKADKPRPLGDVTINICEALGPDAQESPYREGDMLIAGRGCVYPGSQMDGWVYIHNRRHYKPLTPEAEEELKAKGCERVHITGENGRYLMASVPDTIAIGDLALDLVFRADEDEGDILFAEDANKGYRLYANYCGNPRHAAKAWCLVSEKGLAYVGEFQASPPDVVKQIYAALPTHHRELPPDSLCFVCGEDTGGKCGRCGKPICQKHTAWSGEHQYDCWECSEKYCKSCWETRGEVESADKAAAEARQKWLRMKGNA